ELRDETMGKARAMIQQTRRVTSIRQKYEDRAIGELGMLGDFVPDWRDYANYCAVDVNGYSVCNVNDKLMSRYEDVLYNHFYPYRSEVFRVMDGVQGDVDAFLGRAFQFGPEAAFGSYAGMPDEAYIQRQPMVVVQAEQSAALEQAAQTLNLVLDSVTVREIQNETISSGRARQLSAYLAYVEAVVELEVARAQLQLLETKTVAAADKIRDLRRSEFRKFLVAQ